MKTFVFTYKRIIEITVEADNEPLARQALQDKIDQARSIGVAVPRMAAHYEIYSAY